MDKQRKAILSFSDGRREPIELPILSGTTGPDVIDIRSLHGKSGMFTYDPGYLSTASCTSQITYIDGEAGV
ncbi:MAG: citrate (Si)-synthase, partial [Burkholderiales bacterium]